MLNALASREIALIRNLRVLFGYPRETCFGLCQPSASRTSGISRYGLFRVSRRFEIFVWSRINSNFALRFFRYF